MDSLINEILKHFLHQCDCHTDVGSVFFLLKKTILFQVLWSKIVTIWYLILVKYFI